MIFFFSLLSQVYGILHYQHCSKYLLRPDDYEDDVHHFDVSNGDLHVHSSESHLIGHQDYCVDVFKLNDDPDQVS
jgi:hypothetical protein